MNGKEIKDIRLKIGVTQKKLAEMLDVHWRTIQNWEKTGDISLNDYTKLCALLKDNHGTISTQQYYGGNIEQANISGDNIKNGVDISKFLALLEAKEQSLARSQEQIDRLLAIIEKMSNKNNDN